MRHLQIPPFVPFHTIILSVSNVVVTGSFAGVNLCPLKLIVRENHPMSYFLAPLTNLHVYPDVWGSAGQNIYLFTQVFRNNNNKKIQFTNKSLCGRYISVVQNAFKQISLQRVVNHWHHSYYMTVLPNGPERFQLSRMGTILEVTWSILS